MTCLPQLVSGHGVLLGQYSITVIIAERDSFDSSNACYFCRRFVHSMLRTAQAIDFSDKIPTSLKLEGCVEWATTV